MNRITKAIGLLLVITSLVSCVKEVELKPFLVPDLVNSFIRKVEAFENSDALFVASDKGILLRYEDGEQYTFSTNSIDQIELIDWNTSEVLYAPANERFWLISDTIYVELGRDFIQTYVDHTKFFASTAFYEDYSIATDGTLYRTGYYKEYWDPESGSFYSDYYIGLYRFKGTKNNLWEEIQTDMKINTVNLSVPYAVFTQQGEMILPTNPQYTVTGFDTEELSFSTLGKKGEGFEFKIIHDPYLTSNGRLFGLDRVPKDLTPAQSLRTSLLNENFVQQFPIDGNCVYPDEAIGPVKVLNWSDERVRFHIQIYTNQLSSDSSTLGYVADYDLQTTTCSITEIKSDGDWIQFSDGIYDLDVLGNTVYIGTRTGLLLYDLNTHAFSSYVSNLFEEEE